MPLRKLEERPGGFKSTQQKGNIVKGKLKSQKELKKITSSDEYKKADYEGKNKMLNVATHSKGGGADSGTKGETRSKVYSYARKIKDKDRLTQRDIEKAEKMVSKKKLMKGLKKGALVGGQKKLDKNNNNRIDAQDFKILKAEKAKGRGQGLQDEKMKPGKVKPVKAVLGLATMGIMGAKMFKDKMKKKSSAGPAAPSKMPINLVEEYKKQAMGKKRGGVMKKDPSKPVNPFQKKPSKFLERRKKLQGIKKGLGKAGRIGAAITALGVAGAGAAKVGQMLGKKMSEKKNKKMGGGMMQRPMGGYSSGGSVTVKTKIGKYFPTKTY